MNSTADEAGCASGSSQTLFERVYGELYTLAQDRLRHEPMGNSLQATALVNEVYLRLVSSDRFRQWDNAGHFFSAAARAMRCILIDNARKRKAAKRPAASMRIQFPDELSGREMDVDSLLDLHVALSELEKVEPLKAKLVELKFFAGCDDQQVCQALDISRTTAHRYWLQARAWLFLRIGGTL